MPNYSVSKSFDWQVKITERTTAVMRMFGLTAEMLGERAVTHSCELEIDDGDVVYITGPSGSGKSVLLGELEKCVSESDKVNLGDIELPQEQTVIDCIEGNLLQALKLLSTAGLNDCLCLLNQPAHLSDGQKYRFRLAVALASQRKFIFADEFCTGLDRITAAVISYNVHKFAKRNNVTFILAGSHGDVLADLAPDVLVVKELAGSTEIIYKRTANSK